MLYKKSFEYYKFFFVQRIVKIKINNISSIVVIDIVNIILTR